MEGGWFPGRDIGPLANELTRMRVRDAARQGETLKPSGTAVRFIRSYGDLELPFPRSSPEVKLVLDPTGGYDGDAGNFVELAQNIGRKLFPGAFETYECGIWLIDETGRFFYSHHTGFYFLGENEYEAFAMALSGWTRPDAEDFYVPT
ncbi:SUKH-3 domain-containing protein [Streptomyces sp. NPDC001678]|uniref:SUKH-3 domain-containing protein n=1 Tax=Streptomyces sp. NPDC001678 TaxID=3364599 RepID=UPI0036BFBA3D